MSFIGYLGISASKYVAESYEGKDEQFREISLLATEVSGQVKHLESQLMLHLALQNSFNKNLFLEEYKILRNHVYEIKKKLYLPLNEVFIDQIEAELENIRQQGLSLIEGHNNDLANNNKFQIGLYKDQIKRFHNSSSIVRKMAVKIADENTLFLNRQKSITSATEAGSYAKRAEGHLILFLTLNAPKDREKFFKRHTSLIKKIKQLKQLTSHPTAKETTSKMEADAEKILRIGTELVNAYDGDIKFKGKFESAQYKKLILDLNSTSSLLQKNSHKVMLHNFKWETNKLEAARYKAASIQRNIIVLVIICIITTLILGYLLYRPITRSIKQLKFMSSEIGKGNFAVQSTIETSDEFSELSDSFQKMCGALKSTRDQLLSAKETAENANKAKTQFLSRMSHEFRTPLNAIIGFAQLLDMNTKEPLYSDQRKNVEEILQGGEHLLALVNELLDLASIEAGKMELNIESVNLFEHVSDCIKSMEPLANERSINIYNLIDETSPQYIQTDIVRLKQVLLNLLSNAVKYNHPSGSVKISSEKISNDKIRISIADSGPGIPEADMPSLFEPFNRLYLDTYAPEGTGIGLTISRQIIEHMGGDIGVTSELGKGSKFWVELKI